MKHIHKSENYGNPEASPMFTDVHCPICCAKAEESGFVDGGNGLGRRYCRI